MLLRVLCLLAAARLCLCLCMLSAGSLLCWLVRAAGLAGTRLLGTIWRIARGAHAAPVLAQDVKEFPRRGGANGRCVSCERRCSWDFVAGINAKLQRCTAGLLP